VARGDQEQERHDLNETQKTPKTNNRRRRRRRSPPYEL